MGRQVDVRMRAAISKGSYRQEMGDLIANKELEVDDGWAILSPREMPSTNPILVDAREQVRVEVLRKRRQDSDASNRRRTTYQQLQA